jgi:hypothetical protein
METTRRGFFGTIAALLVGARVAPPVVVAETEPVMGLAALVRSLPPGHVVAGISTATFPFWRSQQPTPFDNLRPNMRDVFDRCDSGITDDTPL